jgi:hypothetical protein
MKLVLILVGQQYIAKFRACTYGQTPVPFPNQEHNTVETCDEPGVRFLICVLTGDPHLNRQINTS